MKSIYKMSVLKKYLLLTLTLIFFSASFMFINSIAVRADASTLAMDGAYVKLVDMNEDGVSSSIRFSASIGKDEYDGYLADYPEMKIYMRVGAKETLAAYGISDIDSDTVCSKIITFDVSSAKTSGVKNSNDVYYFRAYATNIKKAYLDKELLCMCYIDNGSGVILAETSTITRSITYVCDAALDDVDDSSGGSYTNKINASVDNAYRAEEVVYGYNGKYSPYSAAERAKLWTGVAEEQFEFFGYTSPTDGSYTIYQDDTFTEYGSGETYQISERYGEYLDSGNNVVLLGKPVYNGKNYQAWEQSPTKIIVDRAVAGGVDKVVIYDNRLVELSKTEGGLVGAEKSYANNAALDTYVASCIADYRYYKGVYGVMLYDEPTYARIQAYAETYASIKRVAPEMFVQTNLLGYRTNDDVHYLPTKEEAEAAGYTLTNSGESLTDYDKRYELYISTFATVSGADYLQFDMYPMAATNIWSWYIRGLTVAANYCKNSGLDMYVVTQTMKMAVNGTDTRTIDEVHARWLNNMIVGFGAKSVSYFTYQAKQDNSLEEDGQYFYTNESFLNRDGERTQLWYDMQKIMQEEQGLAPYILGFDYKNYKIYSGTKTSGYSNGYVTDATFANTTPLSEMSATVNKDSLLVTELKNSDNVYMYMLQNITDPSVSVRQSIVATFNAGYTHVLVFYKGAYSVYELNGSREFKVWLDSGDAVYVVPFTSDISAVSGPQARNGYNKEIKVGSTVNFHDYFVYYTNNCSVSYMKSGEANFTKICDRLQTWTPSSTGVYTLRYWVESGDAAGVHSGILDIVVRVVAPDITYNNVSISNSIVKDYNKGSTLSFATFLGYVNVSSYSYAYTKRIASVSHNGDVTKFSSETSYTFSDIGEYVFTYEIVPEYGNAYQGYITVDVKDIQSGASTWLTSYGATYSGAYKITADGGVMLKPGFYQGITYKNAKSSYIAYNGSYGTGSYVVFDFTGNNLPQLSFFNKTITSSLFDGEEGIYISNGSTEVYGGNASQAMAGRFTVYGPYKISEFAAYNDYALGTGGVLYSNIYYPWGSYVNNLAAISKLALEEGVSYRYIVGFQDGEAGDGSTVKLQVLLINCDTGETVYTFNQELNPATATTTCDAFPADYFTGNIVVYGTFGRTLVLDKVYPVYTGVSDISELSHISSFKNTAPDKAVKNRALTVSDFCDTSVNYTFYYKDASGNKTTVSDSTFSLAAAGEYILYYANNDENENFGSMTITVYDNPWYEVRHQLERLDGTFYYDEDLTDILTGVSGSTTVAAARTIAGYTARAFAQTTVNNDCTTVVNIYYDRDVFAESFETMEFTGGNTREGSYNIIPNANGNSDNTYDYYVYAVNGSAAALSYSQFLTSSDSYSGYKSLEFKNYNTVSSMWVYVRLNDTIQQAVANGASITFRYKVEANDNSCAKYLALEINDVVHNLEIARAGQGEWQEVTLTSLNSGRIKFYVPDTAATGNIAGGAQSNSRFGWNLFIDAIETSTTYTVNKYFEQADSSYALNSSEVFGGTAGNTTSVVAENIGGFVAQTVEQAVITAGHGTVVNVYYNIDRSIESFEDMTSIDSTKYYLTSSVAADAVQLSNLSNVSGSHSVVYYVDAGTVRDEMYANIVLNDTMIEKLEEGNFLSFAWLSSALASSQYTIYSVYAGAAGGTCTQTVVSGIDRSHWNVQKATAIARSGNATFNTFTITDATVLAEIADTGILQIKITADNWYKKLHTTLWVDDIKIIDGVDYTVVTRLLSNDGETYNEYSRQTLKALKGGMTNAVAADIEGFVAPVSIEQVSVADDGSTVIYLDYTRNDLIENFTAETSVNNNIIATTNITSSAIVNDANNFGGKALMFTSNGNDSVAISIAFTEAMKEKLAAGTGILSFRYRMEKVSGSWSGQTVSINGATWDKLDETAGTTTQNAPSFTCWTANSVEGTRWYKATITSDYDDFTDKNNLTITFTKTSGTAGAFYFYIDDIKVEDADSYTVEHYFDDGTGNYVLDSSKTQTYFGKVGDATNAVAYSIPDYSVNGDVVQSVITANNATVIEIYYDYNRLNLDFTEYTAGDNALDIVTSTTHITGYEIVDDASNSGGKALRFETDGSSSGINIQIALTDAQKNEIADGGVLSFRYRAIHKTANSWDRWTINVNGNTNKWYLDGAASYRTAGIAVYQYNTTTWQKVELDMAYTTITDTLNITLNFGVSGLSSTFVNDAFYFFIDDIKVVESATRTFGGYAVGDNELKIVTETANIESYEIVNDSSNTNGSGGKTLRFTTSNGGTAASKISIKIALKDSQKEMLAAGGSLSFRYRMEKVSGNFSRQTTSFNGSNYVRLTESSGAEDTNPALNAAWTAGTKVWYKATLNSAYNAFTDADNLYITSYYYNGTDGAFYIYIDDITVVPAS